MITVAVAAVVLVLLIVVVGVFAEAMKIQHTNDEEDQ